jgi:hypothetical protein
MKWGCFFAIFFLFSNIIFAAPAAKMEYNPVYVDSVLKSHLPYLDVLSDPGLHPEQVAGSFRLDIQPVLNNSHKTMVFVVFLICILIFLLVKFLYPDFFAASAEGFLNLNFFTQLFRSNEYGEVIPFILMAVFRCLVLSLAVLLVLTTFSDNNNLGMIRTYFMLLSLMIITVVIKSIGEYLFNFFSGSLQFARVYYVQVNLLFNVMSLVILPLLLIMFFRHHIHPNWVCGIIGGWIVVSSILYLVRSVQVVPAKGIIYYLHFILYICAFEIIPWLLLTRIIWNVTG